MDYNPGDKFNIIIYKCGSGEKDVLFYVPDDKASIIKWIATTKKSIDNIEYSDLVTEEKRGVKIGNPRLSENAKEN